MQKDLGSKKVSLLDAVRWISTCDYKELFERWYPLPDTYNDTEIVKAHWKFKKLHSRAKTAMMREWCKKIGIEVEITRGRPGELIVNGYKERVELFTNRFNCFYWSEVKRGPQLLAAGVARSQ